MIIFLLLATGIAARKEATPEKVCTSQCGCTAQENEPGEDAIFNKAQSAIVRIIEL